MNFKPTIHESTIKYKLDPYEKVHWLCLSMAKKRTYTIALKINPQHSYFLSHINHFLLLFK